MTMPDAREKHGSFCAFCAFLWHDLFPDQRGTTHEQIETSFQLHLSIFHHDTYNNRAGVDAVAWAGARRFSVHEERTSGLARIVAADVACRDWRRLLVARRLRRARVCSWATRSGRDRGQR